MKAILTAHASAAQKPSKNALEIKRLAPDARVCGLYRDLRSYGFREALYRQARQAGVIFLEYDADNKPKVASTGSEQLKLSVAIQPENEVIELNPDWLVLSAGIEPEPDNSRLAQIAQSTAERMASSWRRMSSCDRSTSRPRASSWLGWRTHRGTWRKPSPRRQAAAIRAVSLLSKPATGCPAHCCQVNPTPVRSLRSVRGGLPVWGAPAWNPA